MSRRPTFTIVLFIALAALAGGALDAQPRAFELLAQVRKAYQELDTYRDRGEIEIVESTGSGLKSRRLRFETVAGGEDAFRLVVQSAEDPESAGRVLGRDGDGEVFLLDSSLGQYRRMTSLAAGVAAILDEGSFDALVVAGLLAGSSEVLADPEGAAVEEEAACGSSTCYLLSLSRMGGSIFSQLWIDRESLLIRQLEVEFHPVGEVFEQAISAAGLPPPPGAPAGPTRPTVIWVRHEIVAVDQLLAAAAGLPAGVRRVEEWEIPAPTSGADAAAATAPGLVFTDEISVDLHSVVIRVVDSKGNPLLGLEPEDLRVWGPSGEVPVLAVDWVSSDPAHRDEVMLARLARAGVRLEPTAKRVVFFVQSAMHAVRIRGHLRTLPTPKSWSGSSSPTTGRRWCRSTPT